MDWLGGAGRGKARHGLHSMSKGKDTTTQERWEEIKRLRPQGRWFFVSTRSNKPGKSPKKAGTHVPGNTYRRKAK